MFNELKTLNVSDTILLSCQNTLTGINLEWRFKFDQNDLWTIKIKIYDLSYTQIVIVILCDTI